MKSRQATLWFVLVTVALDMMAIGMFIPVLPVLVRELTGGQTAQAAEMMGLVGTLFGLMQFLFSPIFGALSDAIGRRPVILFSNLSLGLSYFLLALAPSMAWLIAGRVIAGICTASLATANAYVSDITLPEKRSGAFGILGAAFGIGFILGPALGGLLGAVSPRLPFWVAGGLSIANTLYGVFVLPESLNKESRNPFSWAKANPVASLLLLRGYPNVMGLSTVNFLYNFANYVFQSTFVLYAVFRYGWGTSTVGLTLGVVGMCSAIVQAGLAGRIARAIGERRMLVLGLLIGTTGFALCGLAPTGLLFVACMPVLAAGGLTGPAVQSLLSQKVSPSDQGKLQGAQHSLNGVAGIVGPQIYASVFAAGIAQNGFHVPGAAFFLSSLVLLTGAFVALGVTRSKVLYPAPTAADQAA